MGYLREGKLSNKLKLVGQECTVSNRKQGFGHIVTCHGAEATATASCQYDNLEVMNEFGRL